MLQNNLLANIKVVLIIFILIKINIRMQFGDKCYFLIKFLYFTKQFILPHKLIVMTCYINIQLDIILVIEIHH